MNEKIEKLNKCTKVSPSSEFLDTARAFTEPETLLRIECSQQASIGPQSLSLRLIYIIFVHMPRYCM